MARNNREYDVLTKEIEFQSLEIRLCEKHKGIYCSGKSKERGDRNTVIKTWMKERKDLEAKKSGWKGCF